MSMDLLKAWLGTLSIRTKMFLTVLGALFLIAALGYLSVVHIRDIQNRMGYVSDEIVSAVTRAETVEEAAEVARKAASAAESEAQAAAARSVLIVVGVTVASVLACITAILVISAKVAGPLNRLVQAAERIAKGDLSIDVPMESRDEIGSLAAAFNTMVGGLRSLIGRVQESVGEVGAANEELIVRTRESVEALSQITEAVRQIAAGASDQSRAARETSDAMNRLTAAIEKVASGARQQAASADAAVSSNRRLVEAMDRASINTHNVSRLAREARAAVQRGEEVVAETVRGMERVGSVAATVAEKVGSLGEYSKRIGHIVEIIEEIADQTNLLALNAAIEAARAGAHGRSFAVVAEEVRRLADRVSQSAREIAGLIESMQTEIDSAIAEVSRGSDDIGQGISKVQATGEVMKELMRVIEDTVVEMKALTAAAKEVDQHSRAVTAAIEGISAVTQESYAASEEMARVARSVLASVESIAAVSEESAASVEQISASTQQVNAGMSYIAEAAGKLQRVAAKLSEEIEMLALESRV